jgi:effector-binding domain-containing protein
LTSSAVQFDQLNSVPLAVIRRQTSGSELSRVVPQCCGLVWNAVRAQQARAGRHVAIYWDGSIRLEVGVELHGPFAEEGEVVRSATPAGPVAWTTHLGPYNGLGAAHDAVRQWCLANNRQLAGPNWEIYGLAKRMEYESIADPNRCLLPADLLTPARCDRVAFERDKLAVSSANCGTVERISRLVPSVT